MSDKINDEIEIYKGEISGSILDRAGTYMSELQHDDKLEQRKKDEKEFTDLILKSLMDELNDLAADIKGLVKDRKENLNKLKQANNIMKNWDMHEAQIFLMNQGVDIEGMDENDLVDAMRDQINSFVEEDKSLAQKIADKAQKAEGKMDGKAVDPEFSKEFSNMVEEAEAQGIEADRAIQDANKITGYSNEAIIQGRTMVLENSMDKALSHNNSIKGDPFAEVAENTSISYASAEDDPFAEVAESITDPFNAVASDMGIQPEMKNDLEKEAVSPTIKAEIPTLGI